MAFHRILPRSLGFALIWLVISNSISCRTAVFGGKKSENPRTENDLPTAEITPDTPDPSQGLDSTPPENPNTDPIVEFEIPDSGDDDGTDTGQSGAGTGGDGSGTGNGTGGDGSGTGNGTGGDGSGAGNGTGGDGSGTGNGTGGDGSGTGNGTGGDGSGAGNGTGGDGSGTGGGAVTPIPSPCGETNGKFSKSRKKAKAVLVTIRGTSGKTLRVTLPIHRIGRHSFSSPMSLKTLLTTDRTYELIEFQVLDSDNNILYLTPMKDTEVGKVVVRPLPLSFTVIKDQVVKLVPEVVDASLCKAHDFGYLRLGLNKIDFDVMLISVFAYDASSKNLMASSAELEVSRKKSDGCHADLDSHEAVAAATNLVTIASLESCTSFDLKVSKPGYLNHRLKLTKQELTNSLKSPITVTLKEGEKECQTQNKSFKDGECVAK